MGKIKVHIPYIKKQIYKLKINIMVLFISIYNIKKIMIVYPNLPPYFLT